MRKININQNYKKVLFYTSKYNVKKIIFMYPSRKVIFSMRMMKMIYCVFYYNIYYENDYIEK